jgi:hypothetical protein
MQVQQICLIGLLFIHQQCVVFWQPESSFFKMAYRKIYNTAAQIRLAPSLPQSLTPLFNSITKSR